MGFANGCNYPTDWGEHTVSLRLDVNIVFQPGMTIRVMPGVWLD